MNFFDKCRILIEKNKDAKEIKDDVDNLDKWTDLVKKYNTVSREEVIDFILKVRANNIIFTVKKQMLILIKKGVIGDEYRSLYQLNPQELYSELYAEYFNIVSKGAYDCIKFINHLQYEDKNLANKIAVLDDSIFEGLI